jgi:hypothetical protein
LQSQVPMSEPAEHQRRRTRDMKTVTKKDTDRERRAMDDRCEAVRRWIDDDDEPAIRGID